jgi:hypothetical protein
MSQYQDDLETLQERAEKAQADAALELEWLRIAQAHPEIKFNMAVRALIREYFAGDEITLQNFQNAYSIESIPGRQTLRSMIEGSTQTITEHNKKLQSLSHEGLKQKAREEQAVKQANQLHPAVSQVPVGTPILPAFVNVKWLKTTSMETIKSLRISWDRQYGLGAFNRALENRTSGADAQEFKRLYNLERGE